MKKRQAYLLTATLAAALAVVSCNKEQNAVAEQPESEQTPVGFSAYVNRSTTKAGFIDDDLITGDIKANDVGFGVFAYYTNADNYDQSYKPNFMYNQHVIWQTGTAAWQYSPVKYWPNEFGRNAESDDADKISFFAYAPFVSVNPASGKVNGDGSVYAGDNGSLTEGIVGMKRNNATGDPMIQYVVSAFIGKQVDLVWGTATNAAWALKNGGNQAGITAGKPLLNIQHPYGTGTAQKLAFDFKHALASLNVTVDTKTNSATTIGDPLHDNNTSNSKVSSNTRVFIRSVTFEGFETKGALNLNNTDACKALWYNFDCNNELNNGAEFTIYDGRRDGKEGLAAANKEYAAIHAVFVQDDVWRVPGLEPGVNGTPKNLFQNVGVTNHTAQSPILVIPNGDPLKVTIEYDVLTKDEKLAGFLNDGFTHGSVVKNIITREIKNGTDNIVMENGKRYTIALHLGLNSVEFDAAVSGWENGDNGGADLPHNN